MKKNILITGGLGFIGIHLVSALKENHKITVIDNLCNSSIQTAAEYEKQGIRVLIEDVRRKKKASNEYDAVFHLAAHTSVTHSVEDPSFDASNNILGTISVLKNYPTKKFIYFSSGTACGEGTCSKETDRPNPESPYGISKLMGEVYTRMYSKNYLILRLANIYGLGAAMKSECAVLERFKNDNPLVLFGDGLQTRDFLEVEDFIRIIKNLINKNASGTFNVGRGIPVTIKSLAEKMANGRQIICKKPREGELYNNIMCVDKLRPFIDFSFKTI